MVKVNPTLLASPLASFPLLISACTRFSLDTDTTYLIRGSLKEDLVERVCFVQCETMTISRWKGRESGSCFSLQGWMSQHCWFGAEGLRVPGELLIFDYMGLLKKLVLCHEREVTVLG